MTPGAMKNIIRLEVMNEAERAHAEWSEALYVRHLPDGRYISIYPLLGNNWQLTISAAGNFIEHYDTWTYDNLESVIDQAKTWSGDNGTEPTGWIRHPHSGRRRPDGNPAKEYLQP